METYLPAYKFVEWSDPEELHQACSEWTSELEFIIDEQRFLNELIKNNTLQLISGDLYEKSMELIRQLSKEETEIKTLLDELQKHSNAIEILVDGIDQPKEEKRYKQAHHRLKIRILKYQREYMQTKNRIFAIIKKIMKLQRQQRLLK